MTTTNTIQVSMLGLGAMGSALGAALVRAGHATTVWNRSAGKADALVAKGAQAAATAGDAVRASPLVIVCLLDHPSVHDVLNPLSAELAGRTLINLTTTSPEQSRELAAWSADAGIAYLDGGIMAVPPMIGQPGSSILYGGSASAFHQHKPLLDVWGESSYLGEDAGLASLYDLALLAGMYVMFAGFMHGAAMVAPAGVTAGEFAARAAPWLTAMTNSLREHAAVIDGGDYTVDGTQSLEFTAPALAGIVAASTDQGISTEVVAVVQRLLQRQIDAGHGTEAFERVIESIKRPRRADAASSAVDA
ncbi:NAD(P)-binding domain-containing protein [Micromonospora sp. NPDC005189]|uniref:NAD(P)-dependent oxidoreductase n=1 Tax=unclassified Micromonospora TaxID=2617518 RepID=UPI0033A084C9